MTTKLIYTIGACFMLVFTSVNAQPHRGWKEKRDLIKAEKIAFFTEEMQLTSEEAEKFWPIYNDFENRKEKIHEERRNDSNFIRANFDNMKDDELEKYADKFIEYHKQITSLSEEYHKKFKTVLSSRKLIKLYQVENQFKGHLLKRIRHGRETGKGECFED